MCKPEAFWAMLHDRFATVHLIDNFIDELIENDFLLLEVVLYNVSVDDNTRHCAESAPKVLFAGSQKFSESLLLITC